MRNKWYAVRESQDAAWDNGSDDYQKAVAMLAEHGRGMIAVINENTGVCEEEIEYEELFCVKGEKQMKKTRDEKIDLRKYGQDALDAWNHYEMTEDTDQLANVIRDRLEMMHPQLIKQLYVCGLVFAYHTQKESR